MIEILRLKFGQHFEAGFWVTCDVTLKTFTLVRALTLGLVMLLSMFDSMKNEHL